MNFEGKCCLVHVKVEIKGQSIVEIIDYLIEKVILLLIKD